VSEEDKDKKDLDKRVRALTTLTKDNDIPALAADFFDSEHPLPKVRAFSFATFSFIHLLSLSYYLSDNFVACFCAGPPIPCFSSSSSRGRTYSG
jgi:hypothetical protein